MYNNFHLYYKLVITFILVRKCPGLKNLTSFKIAVFEVEGYITGTGIPDYAWNYFSIKIILLYHLLCRKFY
jgi:hypothetical protein